MLPQEMTSLTSMPSACLMLHADNSGSCEPGKSVLCVRAADVNLLKVPEGMEDKRWCC